MKLLSHPFLSACFILLSFSLAACGKSKKESNSTTQKGRELEFTHQVTFLNQDGDEISTVEVAVADDQQERNQGLMDVTNLGNNQGMLFIFEEENELSFYMANTPLSLDIIFVNSDSTIVRIHHNTTPFSSDQLPSDEPAQFVVETNGGYCVSHDIREGMKIRIEN